jgi:hypothetical protein
MASVTTTAEPPHIERFLIVVVVRVQRGLPATGLTRIRFQQLAGSQGVVE